MNTNNNQNTSSYGKDYITILTPINLVADPPEICLSVLSWNIRRTHNNNSRRHLKEVIRKYCPTFLAILETHVPYARLSSIWTNNGYTSIHVIEVNGNSRGIWILKNYVSTILTIVINSNQ
jgi:hypothetical protein